MCSFLTRALRTWRLDYADGKMESAGLETGATSLMVTTSLDSCRRGRRALLVAAGEAGATTIETTDTAEEGAAVITKLVDIEMVARSTRHGYSQGALSQGPTVGRSTPHRAGRSIITTPTRMKPSGTFQLIGGILSKLP
jgi:hypothetical protein